MMDMDAMEPTVSERNMAIVAAIGRGVPLRTVCAIYDIDTATVRKALEAAGQAMPVDQPGPRVKIRRNHPTLFDD